MSLTKASYAMITGAVINVKDYGAVGDYNENTGAGTNDTAALQAAIDAAAALPKNGAVFIPSGNYKITAALEVPYGVSIFGEGATASTIFALNCNGLQFVTFGYSVGSMFYEDFGITSAGGSNYAAIAAETNAATQDGLYFNRLRIYQFDTGIYLSSNWNCTIENCVMENINAGIRLAGSNGETIGTRILNNRLTYAAGGTGSTGSFGIDIVTTGKFTESVHIAFNQIYGFTTCINVAQATYVTILDNDLSGSGNVIAFVTPAGGYNISNNYIEVNASGTGIYGAPQNTETPTTRSVISSNYLIASATGSVGIKLNGSGGTYQWNSVLRDNTFVGFQLNDIRLEACGRLLVDSNRCMSTVPTNSIYVGEVIGPLVVVTNNYCRKALYVDIAADYTDGKLILANNVENNTFQPTKQSAAPTTGTWRVTDVVMNSAPASGQPAGWVCTVAGTPGTWKAMANLA